MAQTDHPQAAHAMAAPEGHSEIGQTGVDNRKLGLWLFLASECMFFGAFIVAHVAYLGRSTGGPGPEILNIPLTSVSTFVLLMSSLAMVLSVQAAQRDDHRAARGWLLATALLGLGFLGFQAYEYSHFIYHEGLTLTTNLFGTTFYTLTGFHGTHVAIGVGWLLGLLFRSRKVGLGREQALSVELAGLYWHFVDVVWIVIFTVIYLMATI